MKTQDPDSKINSIVLYDGICNLCAGIVLFIFRNDKQKKFKLYALQSSTGMEVLSNYKLSLSDMESVILIRNDKVFTKSKAIFQIIIDIGGLWKILLIFRFFPVWFNDFIYDRIAKYRYLIFGKKKECLIIK